jgi:hypothetical protein
MASGTPLMLKMKGSVFNILFHSYLLVIYPFNLAGEVGDFTNKFNMSHQQTPDDFSGVPYE